MKAEIIRDIFNQTREYIPVEIGVNCLGWGVKRWQCEFLAQGGSLACSSLVVSLMIYCAVCL